MTKLTKWLRIFAIGIAVIDLVGGTALYFYTHGNNEVRSQKVVRMGTFLVAIDYAPYMIAKRNGWFEEALKKKGYRVEYFEPFQSPPPINEAFATGRLDAIFTAEVPSVIGRAAGIDIRIAWLSATLNSEVAIPASSDVRSINNLKGKNVAVLAGTSPHFGFVKNLNSHGMTKNDVNFLDMPPPEAKAAFEGGQVDAWAIWPPFVEQEIVAGKGKVLSDVKSPVQVVMTVHGAFAENDAEALEAIIGILERAQEWVRLHPKGAQKIISDKLGLPLRVVELAWPKIDWNAKIDEDVIADIQAKADFLHELGFIKKEVDVENELMLHQGVTIAQ